MRRQPLQLTQSHLTRLDNSSLTFHEDILKLTFLLNVYLFLREERERQNVSREGQRERETQNLKQVPDSELPTQIEPDAGLELTDREIMT